MFSNQSQVVLAKVREDPPYSLAGLNPPQGFDYLPIVICSGKIAALVELQTCCVFSQGTIFSFLFVFSFLKGLCGGREGDWVGVEHLHHQSIAV